MGMFGPTGFTRSPEVWAIIAPYVERDKERQRQLYQDMRVSMPDLMGDKEPPEEEDYYRLDGLTAQEVIRLLEVLPPEQAEVSQSGSPDFAAFVQAARDLPTLRFHGYVIGPQRDDERISLEGVYCLPGDEAGPVMRRLLKHDPDERGYDEFNGERVYRLWWD